MLKGTNTDVKAMDLPAGMKLWRRNGFANLRVHYSADPDKNPHTPAGKKWYAQAHEGYPTRSWNREMEVDFSVSPGAPVYCDTERIIEKAQIYRPRLRLLRGWDFGWKVPVAIVAQIEPVWEPDGTMSEVTHVLKELNKENCIILEFGDYVKQECDRIFPNAQWSDYGDPAGNQKSDKNNQTSIQILGTLGIHVASIASQVEKGINVVQERISANRLEIDPGCKMLLTGLRGAYYRDDKGEPIGGEAGHPYADFCDAFRYLMTNVFGIQATNQTGTVYRGHKPISVRMGRVNVEKDAADRILSGGAGASVYRPRHFTAPAR